MTCHKLIVSTHKTCIETTIESVCSYRFIIANKHSDKECLTQLSTDSVDNCVDERKLFY
jgi:hypothetical protein